MEDKKRREIKEERTAASKLFENEDHSFTKEIYLDDVHYQDEEGIWQKNTQPARGQRRILPTEKANGKSYFVSIPESRGRYLLPKMHIRLAGHWKTQKK